MRYAIVAILSLSLALALPGAARADKRRTGTILVAVGSTLAFTGLALTATGIWARTAAPGADTLMGFKRLSDLSSDILVPGGMALILAAPLITFGSYALASARRDRPRAGLWVAPAGTGLALGGSF